MKKLDTILLIDDHAATNYYHEEILREANCVDDIVVHYSADRSLDYFRKLKAQRLPLPDLVFLDLNMPGWDGMDFLRMLESFFQLSPNQLKIVILTSIPESPDLQQLEFTRHVIDIQSKPLTVSRVERLLLEHFSADPSVQLQ
ncbi:MAG: response regulator [Saprospiraceae bacterium]|nr:response regulator [Saprospiraceae bacterium]